MYRDILIHNLFIAKPQGKLPQCHHCKDEFVIRIRNHTALVENALDGLLKPFTIRLLSLHDQLDAALDRFSLRILGHEQANTRPCRIHNLGSAGMLDIDGFFTGLDNG